LELLKTFSHELTEEELQEIRKLLAEFFAKRAIEDCTGRSSGAARYTLLRYATNIRGPLGRPPASFIRCRNGKTALPAADSEKHIPQKGACHDWKPLTITNLQALRKK